MAKYPAKKRQNFTENMKIRFRPFDFVTVFIILTLSVFLIKNSLGNNSGKVVVYAGNVFEYSLEKDGIFSVEGELGTTIFEICDKKVRILDSPCPNKTCIALGWSNLLVCLPNNVFIQVEKSEKKAKKFSSVKKTKTTENTGKFARKKNLNEKTGEFDAISE